MIGFFDPSEPIAELQGNLPHWRQGGATYFVTFRLADSLPQEKLKQWLIEREAWMKRHPQPHSPTVQQEYHTRFSERMHAWLDAGYGECVLARPEVRRIVVEALNQFNGERYQLRGWVVMPNHVHVVVTPLAGHELSDILHSWKSFTAKQINKLLGRKGQLWQKESFDHIIRSPVALERIELYMQLNSAGLASDTYTLSSELRTRRDAASTDDNILPLLRQRQSDMPARWGTMTVRRRGPLACQVIRPSWGPSI